jgi:DNA repair exonuclease SbcCD ATPase subunit
MTTPIKLLSLSLKNFMSYGQSVTTINLDFTDPTLIIGRNLDAMVNGQVDSNGSGKTTIINALAWGLYGKPIAKISQDGLINNINKKNLEVTIIFSKNGNYYEIKRFRKNKSLGGDGITLKESKTLDFTDIKSTAEDSIAHANEQIKNIIGMPFDIFTRIVIYSASHEPFFSLPATATNGPNQADIIEELFGLTDLGKKSDLLNDILKADKKELEMLKSVQTEIDRQKSQYQGKIDSIKTRIEQWNSLKKTDIINIESDISKLSSIDFEYQRECLAELKSCKESIKEIDNQVSMILVKKSTDEKTLSNAIKWVDEQSSKIQLTQAKLDDFDDIDFDLQETLIKQFDELKLMIVECENDISKNTDMVAIETKKLKKIADELEHLSDNKCPYCLQNFQDVKAKISELQNAQIEPWKFIEIMEDEIPKAISRLETLKAKKIKAEKALVFDNISKLNVSKNTVYTLTNELKLYTTQVNPYLEVDTLKLESNISEMDASITKLQSKKTKLAKKESILENELSYSNESDLTKDSQRIETLKEELDKLVKSVNPHDDTLNDMQNMKFDDNNYKKIDVLEKEILHKALLYKLLTKKDSFMRKALLNKNLVFLNEKLKYYLDKLGMPHKVRFTEELAASISQFGNELNYDNLSSGQKARVNLALSFSFRDVLQKRYGKISFCILDECLDVGLGTVGVQMAAKMIKGIAVHDQLAMFIISHRDEISNLFPNIMEIELDKGFSRIIDSKLSETKEAA